MADADIVAFGVSSISQFAGAYTQNLKDEREYIERIAAARDPLERGILLTPDDRLRREVIMSILCRGGVRKREIEARYTIDFDRYFAPEIAKLEEMSLDSLVLCDSEKIAVTPTGRLFVRNLAMPFDAWLDRSAATGRPQYSRTV